MVALIKRFVLAGVIVVLLAGGSALATRHAPSVASNARPLAGGCPGVLGPCLPLRA